jgi:hypothetical protein
LSEISQDVKLPALDTGCNSGDTEAITFKYVSKSLYNPIIITIAIAEFCTGFAGGTV